MQIVKTCETHGPLTLDLCSVRPASKGRAERLVCKRCRRDTEKKRRTDHKDHVLEGKRASYARNGDSNREKYRQRKHLIPDKIRARNRRYYSENLDAVRDQVREYQRALKVEVLSHYSKGPPICKECGETDLRFLALDHLASDGNHHRKTVIGSSGKGTYLWAKRNGFPELFQVLCHNDNIRKARRAGYTPSRPKTDVLTHYSVGTDPECAECGESDIRVLTIDHIDGGGTKHRATLGSGTSFYLAIRKLGYPIGLQVLCFNHNSGKRCLSGPEVRADER
ncbi:MAG: hypothetical protein BWY99_00335 [Synergistetes bacterium ADurb.BinA166]|nr:MAG: hypothetical protein BWY99_00335 [Synergistetes bacterium ADurb.BinA166]